jgi:hypothetical protein
MNEGIHNDSTSRASVITVPEAVRLFLLNEDRVRTCLRGDLPNRLKIPIHGHGGILEDGDRAKLVVASPGNTAEHLNRVFRGRCKGRRQRRLLVCPATGKNQPTGESSTAESHKPAPLTNP